MTIAMSSRNFSTPAYNNRHRCARNKFYVVVRNLAVWGMLALTFGVASVSAAPPVNRVAMMSSVQAGLLRVETRLAASTRLPVKCGVAIGTVPIVTCAVTRPGEQRPVVAVDAHYVCGILGADPCSAKRVCSYRVSVVRGPAVTVGFDRIVNVCRDGWTAAIR